MRARVFSNTESLDEMGGRGPNVHFEIDARGADLGAMNRIQRGLEMTHRAAVANAVQRCMSGLLPFFAIVGECMTEIDSRRKNVQLKAPRQVAQKALRLAGRI